MPNLNTHTYNIHSLGGSFRGVKFCSLRGEGKKGWEGRLKNGIKHMITLD